MPTQNEQETRGRGSIRRVALTMLVQAFPGWVALVASLALLSGALPAIFAFLVARLVETLPSVIAGGNNAPDSWRITWILALIGGILLLQEVVTAVRGIVTMNLYRHYDEYLLARVMKSMLGAPRLELFEDPELAAKTDRAVRIARFGPGEMVSGLATKWSSQAQGIAATVLVATVWPLVAVVLAIIWLVISRQLQADYYRANPFWANPLRRARYLKQIAVMPAWAKELRVFGLVEWLGDRFGRQWMLVMDELWQARRIDQRTMGILLIVVLVANAVVLLLATQSALQGTLAIGPLTILVQGLLGMALLASLDGDVWIENGALPAPDVLELERAIYAQSPTKIGTIPAAGRPLQEIRFDNVRFAYPSRESTVFEELDLTIKAGHSLAIVGLNGSGKTTLIKLLTGLEIPQAGTITVDGIDLADLQPTSWQQTVAAIFQDFERYELSARDNIGFGAVERLHTSDADHRIMTAARRASADTILNTLPKGVSTPLSRRFQGGVDLSGGQWQRIALARAMAAVEAGARVLILDEPTAHLDVRAEADLYDRFHDLTHGLTTIVISHRFSTVRRANRIIVLEAGHVTEDGSHDELVAANGQYARLFRKQAMQYTDTIDSAPNEGDNDV